MWRFCLVALTACGRLNFDPASLSDADSDGPSMDGAPDSPTGSITALVAGRTAVVDSAFISYTITVPSLSRGALLVSVHIGSNCAPADPDVPLVQAVSYAGTGMLQAEKLVGTPCGQSLTRTELWLLVDPPLGANDVVVDLSGTGDTVHSAAFVIEGVDQTSPIRASGTSSGDSTAGAAPVTAAAGDLVLAIAGQGDFIQAPSAGYVPLYVANVDAQNTLNNTAAATKSATAAVETPGFTFEDPDDFQIISVSLRP